MSKHHGHGLKNGRPVVHDLNKDSVENAHVVSRNHKHEKAHLKEEHPVTHEFYEEPEPCLAELLVVKRKNGHQIHNEHRGHHRHRHQQTGCR